MGGRAKLEAEHEFTVILDGISDLTPEIMNALFEAGCDDATISRQDGVIAMDFDRAGPSRNAAILSAVADIRKAGIGARAVRVADTGGGRGGAEREALVGPINSVLQAFIALDLDPTLRPLVLDYLAQDR